MYIANGHNDDMKTIINFDVAKNSHCLFIVLQTLREQEKKMISIAELTETYAHIQASLTQ